MKQQSYNDPLILIKRFQYNKIFESDIRPERERSRNGDTFLMIQKYCTDKLGLHRPATTYL